MTGIIKTVMTVMVTVLITIGVTACGEDAPTGSFSVDDIPEYSRDAYVVIEDNVPDFDESDMTTKSFEEYGKLDKYGRCTYAYGNLSTDTMPGRNEERGDISSVHPSGWLGGQGWERCHLIGWMLSDENDNERNLITGTHYLNQTSMLPFELDTVRYIERTGNHVLYRVTPVYEGKNLIASGVRMEAYSVEDNGDGICFDVYCYNVTPGAYINYVTGAVDKDNSDKERTYVLNTNTMKFHYPSCESVKETSDKNKVTYTGKRSKIIAEGYTPCGSCEP